MARKDDILQSFLAHELLVNKYKLEKKDMPATVRDALNSDLAIIKSIAIIVDGLEKSPADSDNVLRQKVLQFLNSAAI